jgi:hypothetical protein
MVVAHIKIRPGQDRFRAKRNVGANASAVNRIVDAVCKFNKAGSVGCVPRILYAEQIASFDKLIARFYAYIAVAQNDTSSTCPANL